MKIALKYGLMISLVAIAWVALAHLLVPDPGSSVHSLGTGVVFNILNIAGIYLAITTLKNQSNGEITFKTGVKTGVATAFVYAFSLCLLFLIAIFVIGPKLLASEPSAQNLPLWQRALAAFMGLFFISLIFGLIYSTLISFFLAKRRQNN